MLRRATNYSENYALISAASLVRLVLAQRRLVMQSVNSGGSLVGTATSERRADVSRKRNIKIAIVFHIVKNPKIALFLSRSIL